MKELKKVRRVFLVVGFLLVSFWAGVILLGRLPDSVEAEGVVDAKITHPVTSSVAGILDRILVEEGDRVAEGDLIAEIKQRTFSEKAKNAALLADKWELEISKIDEEIRSLEHSKKGRLALKTAKLNIAKAMFEHAKKVLERKQAISSDDVLPRADLDKAKTDFDVAAQTMALEAAEKESMELELKDQIARKKAERSQAVVELEQAHLGIAKSEADLEACRLVAPVTGTIMRLDFRPGDLLESGIRLTTVVCDADLRFTALVNDQDLARMREGLDAEVYMDAFPHRKYGIFPGRIEAVAPGADPGGTGPLFRVTVVLDEMGKEVCFGQGKAKVFLRPGQKGRAKIILRKAMPIWDLLFDKAAGHL